MAYFNPNQPEGRSVLHASVRDHAELSSVAERAEQDILDAFRSGEVKLEGYDPDPEAADEELRKRLQRAIGEVTSHRLRYYYEEAGTIRESEGERTIEREAPVDRMWPSGWDRLLLPYYTETLAFG